eukprot:3679760-Pyramimonas_sp.AAC.1
MVGAPPLAYKTAYLYCQWQATLFYLGQSSLAQFVAACMVKVGGARELNRLHLGCSSRATRGRLANAGSDRLGIHWPSSLAGRSVS